MFGLKYVSKQGFLSMLSLLLVGVMVFVACAPEDADFASTATPVTPTMTPTPLPEGEVDPRVEQLNLLAAVLPSTFNTTTSRNEAFTWSIDAEETQARANTPPRVDNGVGLRVFYDGELNQNVEITFAIFDTPEDAAAHYDRMFDVRENAISPSTTLDTLPLPNIVGGGSNRGSIALIQMDEVYFIEVLVTVFDSVLGDPRNSTAQSSVRFLQEAIDRYNTPQYKEQQIESIVSVVPEEIVTGDETWDAPRTEDISGVTFGQGVRVRYRSQDVRRDEIFITVLAFDLPGDADTYYENQVRRDRSLELIFSQGSPMTEFSDPNVSVTGTASSGISIFRVGDVYYLEVEILRTQSSVEPEKLVTASEIAVDFLNAGIDVFIENYPEASAGADIGVDEDAVDSGAEATPSDETGDDSTDSDADDPQGAEESDSQIIG